MTTTPAALAAPPTPPGQLAVPPTASDTLAFLSALDQWATGLRSSLDRLDAAAQQARSPGTSTADITLAMSLSQSINARRDELVKAWDSGRVGPNELAAIAVLLWGRLPDPLGAPSAYTLSEACTIAAALNDRLAATLSTDAIAGSGVAGRIDAVRATIERCRAQSSVLGVPVTHLDELAARLASVLAGADAAAIAATVNAIDAETTGLERDLIKSAGLRSATAHQSAALGVRRAELEARSTAAVALAERCRSRVLDPPRLAVPEVDALGPVPPVPTRATADEGAWVAAQAALAGYSARLDRCAAALAVVEARYGVPLESRDEQRGLLDAYRDRAVRSGLAGDPALEGAYQEAHALLWSMPCDLDRAVGLVASYQAAVLAAVAAASAATVIPSTPPPAPPPAPAGFGPSGGTDAPPTPGSPAAADRPAGPFRGEGTP